MNFCDLAKSVALNNVSYERFRLEERRNDSLTARVIGESNKTFIIKLWKRPGIKGKIRQLTHTGNLDREWKALNLLHKKGIKVPKALACFRFNTPQNGYTDILILEDLGSCIRIIDVLPKLIKNHNYSELIKIEDKIINLTHAIILAGVIDSDHHLVNILILPSGNIARVDFEISTIVSRAELHGKKLAKMISALLITYIFSVQENLELINAFTIRLNSLLNLSQKVRNDINIIVNKNLDQQENKKLITGLDNPLVKRIGSKKY